MFTDFGMEAFASVERLYGSLASALAGCLQFDPGAHLRKAFRKLGVTPRRQLASRLR